MSSKTYKWLIPFSYLYGIGVGIRNFLFDRHILFHSKSFPIPIICIGNLTVGGTGKTPHTEYLIKLLQETYRVGVISRGYKRKTNGYLLATLGMAASEMGDEPFQMKHKYPKTIMAVCANRCYAIQYLLNHETTNIPQVILLDDAFQHRYVKAGLNILLTSYSRPISHDCLLPAGRLREPFKSRKRADIVIVTKCPSNLQNTDNIRRQLSLLPNQQLFFTTIQYGNLAKIFYPETFPFQEIGHLSSILLITGIADPKILLNDLRQQNTNIQLLSFGDHHNFKISDIKKINTLFNQIHKSGGIIVTTEKDATRLVIHKESMTPEVINNLYAIPLEINFLNQEKEKFDSIITEYVRQNQANC